MQEPTNTKQKRFNITQDDILVIFVCSMIIFGILFAWYCNFPLWFNIPLTAILLFSMYYQIMVWIKQIEMIMIPIQLGDRWMNECAYQTVKRGYIFKVTTIRNGKGDETYKVDSNIPIWKKRYVKFVSLIFLILFPAWRYREFEEEDDIWGDDE